MPRRLAVARQAGGFDAIGWTLLGFLLGASLAVFALLHADLGGFSRPLIGASSPPPTAPVPVVRYAPPPAPPAALTGAPQTPAAALAAPSQPVVRATPGVSALASAGAVSAHAAKSPPPAAAPKAAQAAAASGNTDSQVADDAAAAGMTSRAPAAAPSQSQDLF